MPTASKIRSREDLAAQVAAWRAVGEQVVFTNGCFDLVHLGHIDYLERAAALGDRMVIGLNSDSSVTVLKGPSRPILDETSRARLLAALEFVDAVTVFSEETPRNLIVELRPDVLVKGNDYSVAQVAGAKEVLGWGGRVELVDLVEGKSTSSIIAKIKAS